LKIEVHRVGMGCLFGAASLGSDELRPQLVRKSRDDFVLRVKQIGHRLIETFSPEMGAGFCVDELDVDTKPIARTLPSNT